MPSSLRHRPNIVASVNPIGLVVSSNLTTCDSDPPRIDSRWQYWVLRRYETSREGGMFRTSAPVACMLLISLETAAAQQWVYRGISDCSGSDFWCSAGPVPANDLCHPGHAGRIAVCWDNRPGGYPQAYQANCAPSAVWCTYKVVSANQCYGGRALGRMYECAIGGYPPAVLPYR